MSAHTPGPWIIDTDKSTVCMRGERVVVAPAPDNASRSEQIANARLIASAPDLLLALQEIAATTDNDCLYQGTSEMMRDIARAAIAKAEGAQS